MVIIRNSKYYRLSQDKDNKQYYIEKKLPYGRTSIVQRPSSHTKKSDALARYKKLVKVRQQVAKVQGRSRETIGMCIVMWCSGQSYWALDPMTQVRILA